MQNFMLLTQSAQFFLHKRLTLRFDWNSIESSNCSKGSHEIAKRMGIISIYSRM